MVRRVEILDVMAPNRLYTPKQITALIESGWRKRYDQLPPKIGKSIYPALAELVRRGWLRRLPAGGAYMRNAVDPMPKFRKRKPKPAPKPPGPKKRLLKPPSALYLSRRRAQSIPDVFS